MTAPPEPSRPGYTGLVVDARGLGFKPTLKPELYAGDDLVYPGPGLDADTAARQGLARYYRDLSQAQQSPLVGDLPMTVKAGALRPGKDGALALDSEASTILRDLAMSSGGFLDSARVVIVF